MDVLWFLHGLRSPFLTAFMSIITYLGHEIVVVGVLCMLYWCLDKELAFGICISFFVSALLVQGLKIAVRIERPWILDPAFTPVASAVKAATGYSFPSGHTQAAASLFGYLALASRKRGITIGCIVGIALVAVSRMYLGVHTMLDVSIAIVISLLVCAATLFYLRKDLPDMWLSVLLGVISVIILLYGLHLYRGGVIEMHYLSDCFKAAGGCIGCAIGFLWARRSIPFDPQAATYWQQIGKFLIGAVVLFALKVGLKLLFGTNLILDALRYGLIAVWALALYPLLFSRLLSRQNLQP